ncbi:MAG: hypothetical protein IPN60_18835 [Saprospiraceae bacterium]|nr:hypothetical protein [Candidatus Opimibacter skivensis]
MKIILIGNGFDLAHGLKTSYCDFIEYVFNKHIKNKTNFKDFIQVGDGILDYNDLKSKNFTFCNFKNKLFEG